MIAPTTGVDIVRESYDVAVIGAGPAGAAAAYELVRAGLTVALIERDDFRNERMGETLHPDVQPLLRDMGIWAPFLESGALRSWGVRSRWGEAEQQTQSHLLNAHQCGWHVERRSFDRQLAHHAAQAGADLRLRTRVITSERDARGWRLNLSGSPGCGDEDGEWMIHACACVDATGRRAQLGRSQRARLLRFDRLVGIAGRWRCASSRAHLAIESAPKGWWYFAPLPPAIAGEPGSIIALLMTDADLCVRHRLDTTQIWHAALSDSHEYAMLETPGVPDALRVCGAGSQRLLRGEADAVSPWLAVGDAALALDPLTGSGVARALRSGRDGARALIAWHAGRGTAAMAAYEQALDLECDDFLHQRAYYYGAETRWSDLPFWRRRAMSQVRPDRVAMRA